VRGWPRRRGRLSPRERLRTSAGAALGAVAGARGAVLSRGGPAPAPFTLDDTAGEAPPPAENGITEGGVNLHSDFCGGDILRGAIFSKFATCSALLQLNISVSCYNNYLTMVSSLLNNFG
jgi:hypothetical protein